MNHSPRAIDYAINTLRMFSAAGRWVPACRLIDWWDGWDDRDPVTLHAAQVTISRLRHQYGIPVEGHCGWGEYRLAK